MKTKSITLAILLVILSTVLMFPISVFATEDTLQPTVNTNVNTNSEYDSVPNVNINEAETKLEGKAWQIVNLIKTIGKPVCIIGFIISILVAVFGAIGKKGATGGLIGAFIAAVAYVCINYSTEIVLFIQTYLTA